MKRRISLAIAFALSFLIRFGSIASAEEMNAQITVTASQPTELKVFKVPSAKTKKADSPPLQVKASDQVLKKGKQKGGGVHPQSCLLECSGGRPGYWDVDNKRCVVC
jgi:hypothetical protein